MTLGELIAELEKIEDKSKRVYYDFANFVPTELTSWRGSYDQLGLGIASSATIPPPTVEALLNHCRGAIGKTFVGWKGGEYIATEKTPLWASNWPDGHNTAITGVVEDWCVVLETRFIRLI